MERQFLNNLPHYVRHNIKNRSVWLQNGNFYFSGAISFDFAFYGKKSKIFEKSLKFLLTNAFEQCYYVIEDLSVRKSCILRIVEYTLKTTFLG